MKTFPTLYKKSSTGAVQVWDIEATTWSSVGDQPYGVIRTRWGQEDGAVQETEDVIKSGKNIGKKNETTPYQQAHLEAAARWEKQLKKGYVKTREEALAGTVDEIIEGGVAPMLAHDFSKHGHKISYPALAQPKFDGHRCIAVIKDGQATLWTRTRKPITGLPHINEALKNWANFEGITSITLDGELYNHLYRDNFEDLTSFIRNPEPKEGCEAVQYHIYDIVCGSSQAVRAEDLKTFYANGRRFKDTLVWVETVQVDSEEHMMEVFEKFQWDGYEGLMVRDPRAPYQNSRSYGLQKVKEFEDSEFPSVGVEEGRGKLAGHAVFVCEQI